MEVLWLKRRAVDHRSSFQKREACTRKSINPFTAMLAASSLGKRPTKMPNLKSLWLFSLFSWTRESNSMKTHSTEIRFFVGPSNILIAGVYVSTFSARKFYRLGQWRGYGLDDLPSVTRQEQRLKGRRQRGGHWKIHALVIHSSIFTSTWIDFGSHWNRFQGNMLGEAAEERG